MSMHQRQGKGHMDCLQLLRAVLALKEPGKDSFPKGRDLLQTLLGTEMNEEWSLRKPKAGLGPAHFPSSAS